jgi:serine/threonine protein phosphatase PrpC
VKPTLKVWAITDTGCVRQHNEDALCLGPQVVTGEAHWYGETTLRLETPRMLAVVDGMGGHRGGKEASTSVANSLTKLQVQFVPSAEAAQSLFDLANEQLHIMSTSDPALCAMGATVAAIWCHEQGGICINVGDSKVFRFDVGYLNQRSDDHVVVTPDGRRSLVQSMGGTTDLRKVKPAVKLERLRPGRRYLLCTDGLTDEVSLEHLEQLMSLPPTQALRSMVQEAKSAGGHDNISIIIAEVHPGDML